MKQLDQAARRANRVRRAIKATGRLRLSVHRSSKQIYAQIIDDAKGETLVAASSLEKTNRESMKTGANVDAAKTVGEQLAKKAVERGTSEVVFDRGGNTYGGRIAALSDLSQAARAIGSKPSSLR